MLSDGCLRPVSEADLALLIKFQFRAGRWRDSMMYGLIRDAGREPAA
jgi:RimJ/RimL family protein N-acetyltransferase